MAIERGWSKKDRKYACRRAQALLKERIDPMLAASELSPHMQTDFAEFAARAVGGEVWRFCTDQDEWNRLAGWQGYALVQGGRVIETFTVVIS